MNLLSASRRLCSVPNNEIGRRDSLSRVARLFTCQRQLVVPSQTMQVDMEEVIPHHPINNNTKGMKETAVTKMQSLDAELKMETSTLGVLTNDLKDVEVDMKQSPKLLTLVIIQKEGKVLLGMKKRGFGAGYYNGFGGKVEPGETIDEAAVRELQEECGVVPVSMEKRGILIFHFDDNPQPWEVHVYHVGDYTGERYESEEMAPYWFTFADIPYEKMWQDDPLWYPEFLRGGYFRGEFCFHNTHTLVSCRLTKAGRISWAGWGNTKKPQVSYAEELHCSV